MFNVGGLDFTMVSVSVTAPFEQVPGGNGGCQERTHMAGPL